MSHAASTSIVWYRDDLRVSDHAALTEATAAGPTLCIFVWDIENPGLRPLGGAARWWLRHSLASLAGQLEARGGRLDILVGRADAVLPDLVRAFGARTVHWSRRIGEPERTNDRRVAAALTRTGVAVREHHGALLHDPADLTTKAGSFYKVYTPFWRALQQRAGTFGAPLAAPKSVVSPSWPKSAPQRASLSALDLLPTRPDWAGGLRDSWTPGECGARRRLSHFLADGVRRYASGRDIPADDATSRLSPHLRFGEISPRQIWRATEHAAASEGIPGPAAAKFLSELGWREFSHHLLFHVPDLATRNLDARFDAFPWRAAQSAETTAWRRGETGFPLVDAGLRELWRSGFMHNRVRMVVASFLVKDLMIDWRVGEAWFWDTLCDADPANNPASWQWCAGCGADAAPYFRIYNPTLQSRKFDPTGAYIRRWLPELRGLPDDAIHEPAACPPAMRLAAGVDLGKTYPYPIVDHGAARARALAALKTIKDPS